MRRVVVPVLLALATLLAVAPAAQGAQIVTWTTTSAHVDPGHAQFNSPPPGISPPPSALPVNIYLPDGYDPHRRYPVLYLLHGHGDGYWSWAYPKNGDVLNVARDFPGIIVMPEAGQGWYTDWWNGGQRGDPGWESYHLDDLIPLVERRLPIRPGRRWHAIAGLSMGGEGAMYYAEQLPGYFGAAASFSGSLSIQRPEWPTGFNTQGQDYNTVYGDPNGFYATGHNPVALVGALRDTRLFVAVGDGTPGPSQSELTNVFGQIAERALRLHAEDFVGAAEAAGADVTYDPHQGIHDWPYWREYLGDALRWNFFKPVPESPATWTFLTTRSHSDAWGFRLDFAAPPSALERFSRSGDRLDGTGAGTVRVRTPAGCSFTATMPFSHTTVCPSRRANRKHRHTRRRHRRHHRRSPSFAG